MSVNLDVHWKDRLQHSETIATAGHVYKNCFVSR